MITLRVPDMTCGHCASAIARAVTSVDKAARLEVDIPTKLVRVTGSASEGELVDAISEAGYTPEPVAEGSAPVRRASGGCCCASRK